MILGVASEWTERKGLRDFIELDEMLDKKEYVIVLSWSFKETGGKSSERYNCIE